jgi:hypothetical protein
MTILFDLATWHAYAKLRLHTDTTLSNFKAVTGTLGKSMRRFINGVCSQYDTTELPHELAARGRREAALTVRSGRPRMTQEKLRPNHKQLNLSTYKYHALGDYPDLIARFGTTDNASTQTVGLFLSKYLNLCYCLTRYRENYSTRSSSVAFHRQIKKTTSLSLQQLTYAKGSCNALHKAWRTVQDSHKSGNVEIGPGRELKQTRKRSNHSIQPNDTT